jgi:hypothetical protein
MSNHVPADSLLGVLSRSLAAQRLPHTRVWYHSERHQPHYHTTFSAPTLPAQLDEPLLYEVVTPPRPGQEGIFDFCPTDIEDVLDLLELVGVDTDTGWEPWDGPDDDAWTGSDAV